MLNKVKIPYAKYLPLILVVLVLYKMIDRVDVLVSFVMKLAGLMVPLVWALVIAYLVNPMMKVFENKFKFKRNLSLLIVYVLVIGFLVMTVVVVAPKIIESINDIIKKSDDYLIVAEEYFAELVSSLQENNLFGLSNNLDLSNMQEFLNNFWKYFNSMWGALLSSLISITSGIFKIIIGLIISVYILKDKEKFALGCKRSMYAFFDEDQASRFLLFLKEIDDIFSRYIIGKLIDSLIIGLLCFVGLSFLEAPYALLLAIIVGLTNMIPYFGPFIGMIPAVIMTAFVSPMKAVWVAAFIFLLQQFDGYYLGPKILGDSVGLSPFWIILGIIVGGGLFGVLGMLIAVPIVAVALMVYNRAVDKKINDKGIIVE